MNEEYNVQDPVTEVTENTDAQPVEENEEGIELTDTTSNEEKEGVKTYTEADLEKIVNERINDMLPTKIEREKRRLERKYQDKLSKYEETESILSAGLGTKNIDESNQKMREFYQEQGISIPTYQKARYSDEDEKDLGELDAKRVIKLGFNEMQDEANRLAEIGTKNMTVREKAMFTTLANELTIQKEKQALIKMGVKEDILEDLNFRQFSNQFTKDVPIEKRYEMYTKINNAEPKKYKRMGSMKNTKTTTEIKEYYTPEEASKFTRKDYDRNPKLLEAVEHSMTLWGK